MQNPSRGSRGERFIVRHIFMYLPRQLKFHQLTNLIETNMPFINFENLLCALLHCNCTDDRNLRIKFDFQRCVCVIKSIHVLIFFLPSDVLNDGCNKVKYMMSHGLGAEDCVPAVQHQNLISSSSIEVYCQVFRMCQFSG